MSKGQMGYLGAQSGEFLAVWGETPIAAFVNDAKIHNVRLREVKRWPKVAQIPCRNAPRASTPPQATLQNAWASYGGGWGGQREGSQAEACSPSPHLRQRAKGDRKWGLAISQPNREGLSASKCQSWATQSPLVFLSQHRQDGKPSGLGGPGHFLST